MAKALNCICDVAGCGKVKGEQNHWFVIYRSFGKKTIQVSTWADTQQLLGDVSLGQGNPYEHLFACGQAHAHALLDRYFSEIA